MDMIRVLNGISIHDTPVGLVACLPPNPPPFVDKELDAAYCADLRGYVFGVVTKCEPCRESGVVANYEGDAIECARCDGTGYAPLKFVKVLAVWPIGHDSENAEPHIILPDGRVAFTEYDLHLPDAEPGGVALHVEWTDCPTCGGRGVLDKAQRVGRFPCPTCQRPMPTVEGDGPIVEVT